MEVYNPSKVLCLLPSVHVPKDSKVSSFKSTGKLITPFGAEIVCYENLPEGKIIGLSKLARIVNDFARRPQVQERLTGQIADFIEQAVGARGVAVIIEAEHLCMTMRGVKKPGSKTVTVATRGCFEDDPEARASFYRMLHV